MSWKRVADMAPDELEAHRKKRREKAAEYRSANLEKEKARCAAYNAANREKRRAYRKGYYAANREKQKEQAVSYNRVRPEAKVLSHLRLDHGITDPPEELVEAIVTIRRLKRLIKEKQDA